MEKSKKTIIILGSIIITLIILATIIIYILTDLQKNNTDLQEEIESNEIKLSDSINRVTIRNDYYTVKNIVNQYYYSLCNLNKTSNDVLIFEQDEENNSSKIEEEIAQEIESTKKRIYNFFDENYIKETGLTVNNIQEKLGNYNDLYVLIEDMYVRDVTITLKLYFVSGTITEKDTAKRENFKLIITLDSNNSRFNIYTLEYIKKYNLEDSNAEFNISEIENRLYNKYTYKVVNDEEHAQNLLESYTQSIRYNNINYSYSRLDEEYKNNKFKDVTDYEKYIQENKKSIITANLEYYKYNIYEGYIQYICVDRNENYYIFNEKTTMNYDLILDIYTKDLPEFIEKYETATNEEKVTLNVQKIEKALNEKDYKYLYNKLNTTFRNDKFPTPDDLEIYIKNSFFADNAIEYLELIQEGDIYIYKTKVKDSTKTSKEKTFDIIMKLEEGTDFVFSFNVQ